MTGSARLLGLARFEVTEKNIMPLYAIACWHGSFHGRNKKYANIGNK